MEDIAFENGITPVFTCDDIGSNVVNLTTPIPAVPGLVTGDGGICTATVMIEDNIKPDISCQANITIGTNPGSCEATITLSLPTYSDNCSVTILRYRHRQVDDMGNDLAGQDWSPWADATNPIVVLPLGWSKIQWQAKDISNNQRKCTFLIEVVDDKNPVPVCLNPTLNFNGEPSLMLQMEEVWNEGASSDNCGAFFYVGMSTDQITCDQLGNVPITVTVEDASGNIGQCTAMVTVDGLPCNWQIDQNGLGSAPGEGGYDLASSTFHLSSEGCYDPSYYRSNDQHGFIQQELCGDGEIIAQVTEVTGTGWAGISMRESNAPNARMIQLLLDGHLITRRELRTTTGAPAFAHQFQTLGKNWLRLTRVGDQFSAYHSSDGVDWGMVFSTTMSMSNCINIGMITMNGAAIGEVIGIFQNVSVNSVNPLATPPSIIQSDNHFSKADFSIFPNPATKVVHLQLEDFGVEKANIRVYNHLGQIVLQQQWQEVSNIRKQLNLNGLLPGTYMIEIQTNRNRIRKKLMVQGN